MRHKPDIPAGVTVFERGWLSSNNVLCTGRHGNGLIDSGYVSHAPQTLALVHAALGAAPLNLLANTHLHSDHCGGNAALQSAYPALKTLIPHGMAPQVTEWDPVALGYQPTGQQCPAFGFDALLRNRDTVAIGDWHWQVHSAPGHDPDAVILFQPDHKVVISGDALWENGFGVVFPEIEGEAGFEEVAQTLDLIESLQPNTVIPGHGAVFGNVSAALSLARKRLDGFVTNPEKHALHAAKVLIKFKLLDAQQVSKKALSHWALGTHHFQQLHEKYFAHTPIDTWVEDLLAALERSGAVRTGHGTVFNQ